MTHKEQMQIFGLFSVPITIRQYEYKETFYSSWYYLNEFATALCGPYVECDYKDILSPTTRVCNLKIGK